LGKSGGGRPKIDSSYRPIETARESAD